jgi:hypothetical protein
LGAWCPKSGVGNKGKFCDIVEDEFNAVAAGGSGGNRCDAAGLGEEFETGPERAPVQWRIGFEEEAARIGRAGVLCEPGKDFAEIADGPVVPFPGDRFEIDAGTKFPHALNGGGHAAMVVLCVGRACEPEEGDVDGISRQPRKTIRSGEGSGRSEEVRVM